MSVENRLSCLYILMNSFCRFQVTFQKHVMKFLTNVRIYTFNCSNLGGVSYGANPEVWKQSSKTRNLFTFCLPQISFN